MIKDLESKIDQNRLSNDVVTDQEEPFFQLCLDVKDKLPKELALKLCGCFVKNIHLVYQGPPLEDVVSFSQEDYKATDELMSACENQLKTKFSD